MFHSDSSNRYPRSALAVLAILVLTALSMTFAKSVQAQGHYGRMEAEIVARDVVQPYVNAFCSVYSVMDQYEAGNAVKVFGVISAQLAQKGATAAATKISLFYAGYDSLCSVAHTFAAAVEADIAWLRANGVAAYFEQVDLELCGRMNSIPANRRHVTLPSWCADRYVQPPVAGDIPCIYMHVVYDAPDYGAPIYVDQWLSQHLQPGGYIGAGKSVERLLTAYAGNVLVMQVRVLGGALTGYVGWMPAGFLEGNEYCAP